ncbi:MAG: ABC transporter permease [Saprospiraceae bacterium]
MFSYFTKRLLLIIPTLILISIIAFALSKMTPQDTVISVLQLRGIDQENITARQYAECYRDLGYDKALFYFSIVPDHYPKTSNKIPDPDSRKLYKALLKKGVPHMNAENYLDQLQAVENRLKAKADSDSLILLNNIGADAERFAAYMGEKYDSKLENSMFYPTIRWHGLNNQYHDWLKQIFYEGFGPSITDGKRAVEKVGKSIQWTLSFTLVDLFLSILLGISTGVYLAYKPQGRIQTVLRQVLYFFYALPVFWLATILVVYCTTDDYGSWTNIFPSIGMDIYPGKSTLEHIALNASKLILPIICLTLHSLAYVSRIVENSLNEEFRKDYVLQAYSMGLEKWEILTRKVLRNAMIPSITLFVAAFAAAFSGSLVIEVIFNIPGMGRLLYNALQIADWNVVFCILILLSFITIVAYLAGDLLYAFFNPKIKYRA